MNPYLWLFFLTFLPYFELRLTIPLGIMHSLDPFLVWFFCTTANVLIVPVVLLFLDFLLALLEKYNVVFALALLRRIRERAKPLVEKYAAIGLVLFVAIPLPGTGAYSGTIAGKLLGVKDKDILKNVWLGVFLSSIIVEVISLGLFSFSGRFL
jgi:uncharacterized membrane protein